VDVADDAEGSGGDEGADEVQLDEGSPTVVIALSISSCTRVERRLERRWSSGFDVVLDLRGCSQMCGPPTRNLSSLAAWFEERRGVRGGCGVLIGVVLMAITREKSTGVLLRRPFPEVEREGEDCGRREMTRGAHMAERGEGRG
jgi:hypothetical protein